MAERDPTDTIQLKVRMSEALRARLEAEAEKRGTSINGEVVRRLERSFDRQSLLPESLTLAFGRPLAGILMAMGLSMGAAACASVGRLVTQEDELTVLPTYAAINAALMLLYLWGPTALSDEEADADIGAVTQKARESGFTSVRDLVEMLRDPKSGRTFAQVADLLGPIIEAMVDELPSLERDYAKIQPLRKAS